MANENSTVTGFACDDATSTGVLTNISGFVNNVSFDGGLELLDDTGLGDGDRTVIAGLGNARNVNVNGWLNSTTRAIFAPLAGSATSKTKTIELKLATGDYWTGEAWPESVNLSINVGAVNSWSCNFRAQSGLTSTSITAVS
jgi:hypothetical protein